MLCVSIHFKTSKKTWTRCGKSYFITVRGICLLLPFYDGAPAFAAMQVDKGVRDDYNGTGKERAYEPGNWDCRFAQCR